MTIRPPMHILLLVSLMFYTIVDFFFFFFLNEIYSNIQTINMTRNI